jgi:hypothetical protein
MLIKNYNNQFEIHIVSNDNDSVVKDPTNEGKFYVMLDTPAYLCKDGESCIGIGDHFSMDEIYYDTYEDCVWAIDKYRIILKIEEERSQEKLYTAPEQIKELSDSKLCDLYRKFQQAYSSRYNKTFFGFGNELYDGLLKQEQTEHPEYCGLYSIIELVRKEIVSRFIEEKRLREPIRSSPPET